MDFLVLKCIQCQTFQVHQRKKSKKWICKLCGMKQSLMKVVYESNSSHCRKVVQELNMKQGNHEMLCDITNCNEDHSKQLAESSVCSMKLTKPSRDTKTSKWAIFKSGGDEDYSDEDDWSYLKDNLQKQLKPQSNDPCSRKRFKPSYDRRPFEESGEDFDKLTFGKAFG